MKREITNEQYLELKGWNRKYHGIYSDPLTGSEWNVDTAIQIQERREKQGLCFDEIMFIGEELTKLRVASWKMECDLSAVKKKWYQFWK